MLCVREREDDVAASERGLVTEGGGAACGPRVVRGAAGEWKDGQALFMRCSIWRAAAENVAESLTKGTRVIVQGRLVQRSYTTREGENRTVVEMQVDEIGPSLRYAKAQVTRQPRGGGQGGFGGGQAGPTAFGSGIGQPQQQAPVQPATAGTWQAPQGGTPNDPWATGGQAAFRDEPPF